jgi:hypothetical protein
MKLMAITMLAGAGALMLAGCGDNVPFAKPSNAASGTAASSPAASASPATSSPAPSPSGPASSGTAAASPLTGVAPGHATPEAAVAGVIQYEQSGQVAQSCQYVEPAVQSSCAQAATQVSAPPITSVRVTIAWAVISGRYALVEVTGQTCTSATACLRNSNPDYNMPVGGNFMTIYNKQLNTIGDTLSPVPCIRVNNLWYVNESQ